MIHKINTIYASGNRNVTKHSKLFNVTDNNYYTKGMNNTRNITNNITKHNHNNYEHNVLTKVNKPIKHNNNLYSDTFNFRKTENISLSQQTDIVNNITETNNQTRNYIDDSFLNNNRTTSVEINIGSDLKTDNYTWVPEPSDNVVPGLESLLTYLKNQYITLITLNGAITVPYNQTMLEVEDSYLNKDYIATYITVDNNLQWFPRISDLFVPGLNQY